MLISFNPCYSGNGFGRQSAFISFTSPFLVSILVIVEMGLVDKSVQLQHCTQGFVSILVIVEMGLVGKLDGENIYRHCKFQSLL